MALLESNPIILDSEIPNFENISDVYSQLYSLKDFNEAKLLVIIFMCNHCPYVKAVLDRINSLARVYKNKGVQFAGVNSNDAKTYLEDSFENMKKISRLENFEFLYLFDESQNLAKSFNAVCTPDIFVYAKNKEKKWILKYHGAIDDNWKDFLEVKTHYLRDAIEELLADKEEISFEQKPSMGCSIKWK